MVLSIGDDRAFADYLRSARSTSEERVAATERVRSTTLGEYLNRHRFVHHVEESRH